MKNNWVKGLDRIAILLAIPIAILLDFSTFQKSMQK